MLKNIARLGSLPPLTVALIIVSVVLSVASRLGSSLDVLMPFFIAAPGAVGWRVCGPVKYGGCWSPYFFPFADFPSRPTSGGCGAPGECSEVASGVGFSAV